MRLLWFDVQFIQKDFGHYTVDWGPLYFGTSHFLVRIGLHFISISCYSWIIDQVIVFSCWLRSHSFILDRLWKVAIKIISLWPQRPTSSTDIGRVVLVRCLCWLGMFLFFLLNAIVEIFQEMITYPPTPTPCLHRDVLFFFVYFSNFNAMVTRNLTVCYVA